MTHFADDRLPSELQETLAELRSRIRRYVLVEGIALVLVVVCGLFWLSFATDWIYFRVSRLELPGWFRSGFFVLMLCSLAAGVLIWIVTRLLRRLRSRALALIMEKRFPELDDRLITAVELAENGEDQGPPLSSAMQRQTLRDASTSVRNLDVSAVFDRRPLNRAVFVAALLATSIAGFGIANAAAVGRWYHAFVLAEENYWDPFRKSSLDVSVVSQPGERIRRLSSDEAYRHPRGADLVVRVDVPEGKVVPEQVTLHYRTIGESGSGRGRVTMTQIGDRTFRHALTRAVDDHQLWVVGGDFTNRLAYRVEAVDPPTIDRITLDCDYPNYTGMDAFADQLIPVQGSQVSLPVGTRFLLRAEVNKPLVGLRLRCPVFDLDVRRMLSASDDENPPNSRHNALSIPREGEQNPTSVPLDPAVAEEWFTEEGGLLTLPLVLSPSADDELAHLASADVGPATFIPIPPDVPLQFELFDVDDVQSSEPIRLTVNGIVDLPPTVETRLKGIGRSVTRLASIPIEGAITDDYGVAGARFGYRVDDETEYQFAELTTAPDGRKAFTLGEAEEPAVERFLVRPLELSLGQKLILTLFAADADDVTGPHESHGEVYTFRIVSAEDLLAELYDKELNLRQRFEQIISEVRETREDLAVQRERSLEARRLRGQESGTTDDGDQLEAIQADLDAAADRRLNSLRKNHTETRSIEELFLDIRAELVNNRVDTSSMLERIDDGIVTPLHQINEIDYPEVDRNLALFKLVNEDGRDPTGELETTLANLDGMLDRMEAVLREMRRRETFNELVKRFQAIIDTQAKIRDETKKARNRALIGGAFDFDDSK